MANTRFTESINQIMDCDYNNLEDVVHDLTVAFLDGLLPENEDLTEEEEKEHEKLVSWGVSKIKSLVTLEIMKSINRMD